MKLGRKYQLSVQVGENGEKDNTIVISDPLTLHFEIVRSVLASANTGSFRILNLRQDTRNRIFKGPWNISVYRKIVLQAGYEDNPFLPSIFVGNVQSASTFRQGPDFMTQIEAFDGGHGIQNGQADVSLPAGYTMKDVLLNLVKAMPNVVPGAMSDLNVPDSGTRGITLSGNAWDLAQKHAGPNLETFIDKEVANFVGKDRYLSGEFLLINAETGLLGTPRLFYEGLDVTILFEPRVFVDMKVVLESSERVYNGTYAIKGITHRGTISGAVGGQCTTTLRLWGGKQALKEVTR